MKLIVAVVQTAPFFIFAGKKWVFLDLENPVVQKIFEEINYDNIVANLREFGILPGNKQVYIFLDEIQAMPGISRAVKYLFNHFGFKFFLTGSSSYYLKNLFPENLAGRKFVFELRPLDFEEFLTFKSINRDVSITLSQKDKNKNHIRFQKLKGDAYKLGLKEYYIVTKEFVDFPGFIPASDL